MAQIDLDSLHQAVKAVCPVLSVRVGNPADRATWSIQFAPDATAAQQAAAASVLAAHSATTLTTLALDVIQARIEAQVVGGTDGWTTYVNYIFGAAARRNAFLKIVFMGRPLRADHAGLRTTLAGSGFSQAQIDAIVATP